MTKSTDISMPVLLANEAGYDPVEDRLRENILSTVSRVAEELSAVPVKEPVSVEFSPKTENSRVSSGSR